MAIDIAGIVNQLTIAAQQDAGIVDKLDVDGDVDLDDLKVGITRSLL